VRLYVPIYGRCTRLRPSAHEESRGYIQLLKLEAPSPLVKHSGKRSCCNSTPRHPRRRCRLLLLLRFFCFFPLDVARPFLFRPSFLRFSSDLLFLRSLFSLVLRKLIYSYIPFFFLYHYLSLSPSLVFYFLTFQCNFTTTGASILIFSYHTYFHYPIFACDHYGFFTKIDDARQGKVYVKFSFFSPPTSSPLPFPVSTKAARFLNTLRMP
jgi:hypothetical protein